MTFTSFFRFFRTLTVCGEIEKAPVPERSNRTSCRARMKFAMERIAMKIATMRTLLIPNLVDRRVETSFTNSKWVKRKKERKTIAALSAVVTTQTGVPQIK